MNKKKITALTILIIVLMPVAALAREPLDLIEKKTVINWEWVISILSPVLEILGLVLGIGGILLLVGAAVLAMKWIGQSYLGQKGMTKERVKLLCGGVIVSLLLMGTGWVSIIRFVNNVLVQPARDIIDDEQGMKFHIDDDTYAKIDFS